MRRKIGSTFYFKDKLYQVCEKPKTENGFYDFTSCSLCAFVKCRDCDSHHMAYSGECEGEARGDNKCVYFKQIPKKSLAKKK